MSPIEAARVQPRFGAAELRVYRFEADQPGETPEAAVWVHLLAEGVSARCQLTTTAARQVAAGLLSAADAADSAGADA
ncbi:MAG: hypothetical protein ACT6S0_21315 [Roseateles sp.]|uniref:hypothetical protein n=1 Tax=Roseateles sp. TaxID=1971397 RepID=UPI0040365836